MSRNRKNNHYHYAEKFDDQKKRSKGKMGLLPFKSVIISLAVLLMFGLVSTTFATYVSENVPENDPEGHYIISEVRNLKASREISYTGASGDWASSGATWSFSGTSYIYFNTTWSDNHIQLIIGKDGYSSVYQMTKVTGTSYYVCQLPTTGWTDATYMCVIGDGSAWDSGSWGSSNRTNANHYSAIYTSGLSASDTQRYKFTPSSANNGCTLTLNYLGTGNDALKEVTLTAQACYTNNGTTYTEGGTGGTVKITGYYYSSYNTLTSSTTSSNASETYNSAITTNNSTFTATAANGYRFVGWYSAANDGTLVSSSTSYNYQTTGGDKSVYARFIKRVTVTPANGSGYTDGDPTVGGSTTGKTVDIGESVSLDAHVTTGITAVWKSGGANGTVVVNSETGTYTPTDSITLTACYTLTAPTFTSYSYASPITVGSASNLTKNISSATGVNTGLRYTFTATPLNDTASDPAVTSSTWSFDSSGNFTPTIPGEYQITVSVYDTASGLTSTSVSRNTAIVRVRPAAPAGISYEVNNYSSGTGTWGDPYMVPVNSTTFSIKTFIPGDQNNNLRDPNCTYNWSRVDGRYTLSTGSVIAGSNTTSASTTGDNGNGVTDTSSAVVTDVIHNAVLADTSQGYIYKVSVTAQRNGVESDPYPYTFYYNVTNDFLVVESFDFKSFNSTVPKQKIYDEDNTITQIDAVYDAGGNQFDTMLWFSKDNISYNKVAVWTAAASGFTIASGQIFAGTHEALPDNVSHQISTLVENISTIARNSVNLMSVAGPKWFKGYVGDENGNSIYPELHTTVGTSSTASDRPVYYVDATANQSNTEGCRVMAFFTLESDETPIVHYQTAQEVSGRSHTYRFYIPADAVKITFAHVAANNYVIPQYIAATGGLDYSGYASTVLKAWTPTLDLTSSDNYGMTTFKADTPGTPVNGVYNYTNTANEGNMTTLD